MRNLTSIAIVPPSTWLVGKSTMMIGFRIVLAISAIFTAGQAIPAVPFLNATCPGNIDVHADAGGPVYLNG